MKSFNYFQVAFSAIFVLFTPSLTDGVCRKLAFLPRLEDGFALRNHIIREIIVDSVTQCRIQCYLDNACQSYNTGPSVAADKKHCQINSADKHRFPDDFKPVSGYSYHELYENPCRSNPCVQNKTKSCQVGVGETLFKCECKQGFRGVDCDTDINECSELSVTKCASNAQCINTEGSYDCRCPAGYIGDGISTSCVYINECALGNFSCPNGTSCQDIPWPGLYECQCPSGYTFNKSKCEDIDECSSPNSCDPFDAVCTNTDGSYLCACKEGFIGSGQKDDCFGNGEKSISPGKDCKAIKDKYGSTEDKIYHVDPSPDSHDDSIQVYCDMNTQEGGWTLVWNYQFKKLSSPTFKEKENAVIPTPKNYNSHGSNSSTAPTDLVSPNAMEKNKWRNFGSSFLIKSDFNNHISCFVEGSAGGFLTGSQSGAITCTVFKKHPGTSCTTVPNWLQWDSCGASVGRKGSDGNFGYIYRLETCTDKYWPIHDPCGNNSADYLPAGIGSNGISNVFVRNPY